MKLNESGANSGRERIEALYRVHRQMAGEYGDVKDLARAIAVELTVEVPEALIARFPALERDVVARVDEIHESPDATEIQLSFDPSLAEGGLPQLINLLSGNVSMLPGIELLEASLPPTVESIFSGPKFGIQGIRERLGNFDRPIVATALKPRGAPLEEFERVAEAFSRGGGEVIKDDHNLVEGRFEDYAERVLRIRDAVRRGSESSGTKCLYHALLTGPLDELERRIRFLESEEIDGVLVAPMLLGLEGTRQLIESTDRLVWTHPSFTGAVAHPAGSVLSPAFLHGTLFRWLGADAVVFVNHGGRFPISRSDCRSIAESCRAPRGAIRTAFPVPAGGMTFDRIGSMIADYGHDTILLIGGDLLIHEAGIEEGTRKFLEAIAVQSGS